MDGKKETSAGANLAINSTRQRPKPAGGIQAEILPGGVIIYQADGERILQLNESSALIWGLCNGEHTVGEITAILQALFPGEEISLPRMCTKTCSPSSISS